LTFDSSSDSISFTVLILFGGGGGAILEGDFLVFEMKEADAADEADEAVIDLSTEVDECGFDVLVFLPGILI
jgi:hypothetical protein